MSAAAWILGRKHQIAVLALRFIGSLAILAAPSPASDQATYLIDDFEAPTALKSWRVSSSYGSSPSDITLALGPGYREHGAVFSYRLSCEQDGACETYAAALWTPKSKVPKKRNPTISLWIRYPVDVEVALLVKNTGGQTARLPIRATLEHYRSGSWQYVVLPLSGRTTGDSREHISNRGKGHLMEIGISVQPRVRGTVKGTVSFDDIRLRSSPEIFYVDGPAQDPPLPAESFEFSSRLGVNVHLLKDDHALDAAHAAGFGFVRMDLLWANVERRGRYRFFAYDALLRALEARDMGVLWILDYGHPEHGGSAPRAQQDIAAFGRFAEATATHFRGHNVRYEIWNEPNTIQYWPPSPNASEYTALLREALNAIRRVDSSALVSSGGLSRLDLEFLSPVLDPVLASNLSAIGVHPYPRIGPEVIAADVEAAREKIASSFGEHIQLWDTEWGYSSSNAPTDAPSNGHTEDGRRRQANLAVRELLTVWILQFPVAVWYDLRDDGPDPANPEQNYGLLDSAGNEKPAMQAIRTFISAASHRKYKGMIQDRPVGVHAVRFDGPDDRLLILWTDGPGKQKVEYSKHNFISATDSTGKLVKSKDRGAGKSQVETDEASGPIYLLLKPGT